MYVLSVEIFNTYMLLQFSTNDIEDLDKLVVSTWRIGFKRLKIFAALEVTFED